MKPRDVPDGDCGVGRVRKAVDGLPVKRRGLGKINGDGEVSLAGDGTFKLRRCKYLLYGD